MAGRDPLRCHERNYTAQPSSNRPSLPAPTMETAYEAPNCAVPKDDKQDDRCQQRRMAQAADESACIARWQFWVSLVGLGGLLGTIIYAAKTASAASETAAVSGVALALTQRAYLSANPYGVTNFEPGKIAIGHVGFYNAGNMPAQDVSYAIYMEPSDDRNRKAFPIHDADLRGKNVISPKNQMRQGAEREFGPQEIEALRFLEHNEFFVYVWGVVWYGDGLSPKRRRLAFCHRYDSRGYAISKVHPQGPCIVLEGMRYHEHGNEAD